MKINLEVSDDAIMNLLCSAFESSAIDYWCRLVKYENQKKEKPKGKWLDLDIRGNKYLWLPLSNHGAVILKEIDEEGAKPLRLHRHAVRRGIERMAVKAPHQFGNLLKEDTDINTADCFVQLCFFDDVKYG